MTNFHSEWSTVPSLPAGIPVHPARRLPPTVAFYASMLLPGISIAFHAEVLGRCRTSVATYRTQAARAAALDPRILDAVTELLRRLRPEDGLAMARARGPAQLPYWSRLAIKDYCKRGLSRVEIAEAFMCSPGTVANILQGKGIAYGALSGERRLSASQQRPSNRWAPARFRS